ncbi:MAG TPA: hypothetical protein VIU16_02955 [Gaiellaceae bacterium]
MALIVDFPDLAAAAGPTDADLNAAVTKFVEQLGGVDGAGVLHAGNLDLTNHVATPGFRNAQKVEARSVMNVSLNLLATGTEASTQRRVGPFPYDVRIVGAGVEADVPGGTVIDKAGLRITIGDQIIDLPASVARQWAMAVEVPPGTAVYVEAIGVTYVSGGPATELRAGLWLSMEHRS